jgi:hypothetical protein
MSQVEQLLDEYIAEHRAGGDADPVDYLERLQGTDREQLAVLIDAYLSHAPRRPWDPDAYVGSEEERLVESLDRAVSGVSGLWPVLLPRLRDRARLKRSELVSRLAEGLGVSDRQEKVAGYYHEMEQGRLPATGVKDGVLEGLGTILGESADALREAGNALRPQLAATADDAVFARTAQPRADWLEHAESAPPPPAARGTPGGEWDDVDELFRGGAP